MKVAVLGSWRDGVRDYLMRGSKSAFEEACKDIGRELARRQQIIIVGGQSDNTADSNVVTGYISVAGNSTPRPMIQVVRPDDDSKSYHDLADKYPKLFSFPSSMQYQWGSAHLIQIRDADAVLTVGGVSGTYQAGLAAIVARKLLVPVGSFGGAAAKLSNSLQTLGSSSASELGVLNGPWNTNTLSTAMALLGMDRKPKLLIIHGHGSDRYKLTEWLRASLGLTDLIIMQQEFGAGRALPEKFETMAEQADGAIAIATPDDLGGVVGSVPDSLRARQNVWIEVGWIWGRLGRNKLALLCKGDIEIPTDLQGMEHYRYSDSPMEVTESIRDFIRQLGHD
jgi:predicted nucleotide-binding protein